MSVPAVVALAASLATRDHQGIIGYRFHRTVDISAGFYKRHDDIVLVAVYNGDRLVGVRVLDEHENGHAADDAAKQKLAAELRQGQTSAPFAVPFDARHFAEYRYKVQGNHVEFSTDDNDAQHGSGSFDVDNDGDVTRLVYTPKVLPKYATSATVQEVREPVLPHFWATVRSTQSYTGRYAILHGKAEFVSVESDFHRFDNLDAAMRWLQAERI